MSGRKKSTFIANQPVYTVSDESWLTTTGNMQLYIELQNCWGKTVHTFQKEICTLQLPDNSLSGFDRELHIKRNSLFLCVFPCKKWRNVKVNLTFSHILCYIWTMLAWTLTSSIHFEQVHAPDSLRNRGTHLMNDSSQMTVPALRITI